MRIIAVSYPKTVIDRRIIKTYLFLKKACNALSGVLSVSYTHLDVYKRQIRLSFMRTISMLPAVAVLSVG